MVSRRASTVVGLIALMGLGKVAWAVDSIGISDDLSLTKPLYLDDQPPAPLEGLLQKWGLGQDKIGFNVYGFVEGSYTASFSNPPGNVLAGRVFEAANNEDALLNQIDLIVERTVDAGAAAKDNKWGIGGRMEWLYGSDARYIHSNGLNFYGSSYPQMSPENQFDLVQAYVDVAVPVGTGLTIRTGKFVTLLGYETINPTTNALYSHSYSFGYAIPFTNTGVLGMYNLSDKLSLTGGISRGWDQALEDNNSAIDALGQAKYVFSDKLTGYFNFITGPEQNNNDGLYRTVVEGIASYQLTDALSVAGDAVFGFEPAAGTAGQAAQWYGLALYGGYKLSEMATINLRGEWFADPQGARGLGGNEYELTLGVGIKPFPGSNLGSNLLIRPELRYDYSDNMIFDGGTQFDQWTAAVDAIFTF